MNKFLVYALVAVAVNIANFAVASPLLAFAAAVGMIYLAIYGAIMVGLGVANGVMMLTKNKTITENMKAGGADYGRQNAKALTVGYGSISLMTILVVLGMNGVGFAVGAAIILGLLMFAIIVLGHKAKLFRDGKYRNHNI